MIQTEEELKTLIETRYGSFELSHDKNVAIVENILEFILDVRKKYAEFHVEEALKAAGFIANDWENSGELEPVILNAYPLINIK